MIWIYKNWKLINYINKHTLYINYKDFFFLTKIHVYIYVIKNYKYIDINDFFFCYMIEERKKQAK